MTASLAATPVTHTRASVPIDELVMRTGLRMRLKQAARAAGATLVSLAVLGYLLYGRVDTAALLLWEGLVAAGSAARWIQAVVMLKRVDSSSIEQLYRDAFFGSLGTATHSLIVGTAFWFLTTTGDGAVAMNLTLASVLFTLPTFVGGAIRPITTALGAVVNIGQGVLFWFGLGPNHQAQPVMAVMLLLGLGMFVTFVFVYATQFGDSVRIRTENVELLSRLENEKKIVELALREAREASESKSRFLAAASHDLRQPLHALTMFLGTLSFHVAGDEAQRWDPLESTCRHASLSIL